MSASAPTILLHAIGTRLRKTGGLAEVRFTAAESLAYLDCGTGAEELGKLAEQYDALRAYCMAALASLENVYGKQSPEGNLVGLGSKHADLRRLSLVRLFQRKLLGESKVQTIVRLREEDQAHEPAPHQPASSERSVGVVCVAVVSLISRPPRGCGG